MKLELIADLPDDWDDTSFSQNIDKEVFIVLRMFISKSKLGEIEWSEPAVTGYIKPCPSEQKVYEYTFDTWKIQIQFYRQSEYTEWSSVLKITDSFSSVGCQYRIIENHLVSALRSIVINGQQGRESFDLIRNFRKKLEVAKKEGE